MITRVSPGRSRRTALNDSIAPTTRSVGAVPANRTWSTACAPASVGAAAVASATIRARTSSGTGGESSCSSAAWGPPGRSRWADTGSAGAIAGRSGVRALDARFGETYGTIGEPGVGDGAGPPATNVPGVPELAGPGAGIGAPD